jgi:hypothetical protein
LNDFRLSIRETGFCNKAQKALINVADLYLPTKAGGLKLQPITLERYSGLKYTYVPLIGYHKIPAENPDQENAKANPYPFGCGLGYQKGIAWMIDSWFRQHAVSAATGSLAIGLLNLGILAFAIAISLMQSREDSEGNSGRVDKWDTVKDIPSNFANTVNPTHQIAIANPPVVVVNGGSSSGNNSANNSARNSVMTGNGAPMLEKSVIFEQLRDFYAKYDKQKILSDVEDVAAWGVAHGMDALNGKLRSKYNADLSSMTNTAGLGTKALQADLEI